MYLLDNPVLQRELLVNLRMVRAFVLQFLYLGLLGLLVYFAWPHDQKGERWQRTIPINGKPQPTTSQLFWAGYSGVVFLPSTVGPAGLTKSGLPVGYQAIAPHGHDKTAIAFSRFVEREIGGFVPPAGYE